MFRPTITRPAALVGTGAVALALVLAGCGSDNSSGTAADSQSSAPAQGKQLEVAYLSFAVANSYDAPMLAAAKAAASAGNATLTVFDANNSPQTQFSQFQNVISARQVRRRDHPAHPRHRPDVLGQQAIAKGIKVVNIDQILGPDFTTDAPQVQGCRPTSRSSRARSARSMGKLAVQACQSKNLNPCNVGYLYDVKASTLDVAIHKAFTDAVAADSSIKVVAEGETFFTPAPGLTATQDMLHAIPTSTSSWRPTRALEGAASALGRWQDRQGPHGRLRRRVRWRSGRHVKAGTGPRRRRPGAGLRGQARRAGSDQSNPRGHRDTVASTRWPTLPERGVITKANARQFTAEWPG